MIVKIAPSILSADFTRLGEQVQDNRIGSLELTIPASGPMSASVEMMGRVPNDADMFDLDPYTDWNLAAASYEADNAFGLSVDGNSAVRFDGGDLYCTGLVATMQNSLLPPNQGQVIGAYTPLDYPVMGRAATIRATVLVTNYNLYRDIYAGGHAVGNTKFSSQVKMGDLDFRIYSPATFNSGNTQYAMQVRMLGANIAWALPAPLPVNPQQPMIMTLIGTVQRPASGNYLEYRFQNAAANAYAATKAVLTGATISFSATTGNHILDSGSGFVTAGFAVGDKVIVSGSASNDGVYTVTAVAAGDLTVTETVTPTAAGATITLKA